MPSPAEALALLWQAVVVTVIGFVCWYSGMQRIGAERATLFSGPIPVSAALTAPLIGTGTYGAGQGVGSLLVGLGAALGSGVLARRGAGASAARVQDHPRHGGRVVVHRDVAAGGKPDEPCPGDHTLRPDTLSAQKQTVLVAPGDTDRHVRYVVGERDGQAGLEGLAETGGLAQGNGLRHDRTR